MNENKEKKWHGAVAVLAFLTIFYVGGLYAQYIISDKQFIVRFVALILSFIYSLGQAGAFDK